MRSIITKSYIANQILKALPLPLDGDQNGEIKIKIHSDRGETNWLNVTPAIMRKIEFYLLEDEIKGETL